MSAFARDRVAPDLNRREFLRLGSVASFVLATGCAAARRVAPATTAEGVEQVPVALTPERFAVLVALVEGLYPGDERRPAGVALGLPQRIDQEVYFAPPHVQEQIGLALDVLEHGAPLTLRWGRFTELAPEERPARVERFVGSSFDSLRQVGTALSQLVKAFYYADERTWAAIGYDGPMVPRKAPDSEAHYARELARARR